tara:strand:+ start:325 stop:480 length:156 start_codon:yes stop_codon:yes gene_type:complete
VGIGYRYFGFCAVIDSGKTSGLVGPLTSGKGLECQKATGTGTAIEIPDKSN